MSEFRGSWVNLKQPSNDYAVKMIKNTNAIAAIDSENRPVLFLHGVTDSLPKRTYRHLELKTIPKMNLTIDGKSRPLTSIILLEGDHTIDIELFGLVMEHLNDLQPSGNFRALDIVSVLDNVKQLVKGANRQPTREEVKGAWGEVHLLSLLLRKATSHSTQKLIISAWEGDEHQESIDFRFNYARIAIEVKTTESSIREHVIHGLAQLTLPEGYLQGVLASIRIIQTDTGITVKEMITSIEHILLGSEEEKNSSKNLLNQRQLVRGSATDDDRFRFTIVSDGLVFYPLENVPKPRDTQDVVPMEWLSNLSNTNEIESDGYQKIFQSLT